MSASNIKDQIATETLVFDLTNNLKKIESVEDGPSQFQKLSLSQEVIDQSTSLARPDSVKTFKPKILTHNLSAFFPSLKATDDQNSMRNSQYIPRPVAQTYALDCS